LNRFRFLVDSLFYQDYVKNGFSFFIWLLQKGVDFVQVWVCFFFNFVLILIILFNILVTVYYSLVLLGSVCWSGFRINLSYNLGFNSKVTLIMLFALSLWGGYIYSSYIGLSKILVLHYFSLCITFLIVLGLGGYVGVLRSYLFKFLSLRFYLFTVTSLFKKRFINTIGFMLDYLFFIFKDCFFLVVLI